MSIHGFSSWLEIDLNTIRQNVRELLRISQNELMAVVKANGYGHGAVEIAQAALSAGATWLGVARFEEAITLRQAGLTCPILVLGYTSPEWVLEAVHHHISLTVYDNQTGAAYAEKLSDPGDRLHLHIKVDTGMSRLGISPELTLALIESLARHPSLKIDGLFTHFARADEPQIGASEEQLVIFDTLVQDLRRKGVAPRIIHAANSAAILNYPHARYDLVRPGISLYGYQPSPHTALPDGIQPALTWKTRLTSVNTYPAGRGVSYGHIYTTHSAERIGATAIGYADGFRRMEGNFALVRGIRVPVVGRVCMDQAMLQLDTVPDARMGDEVVLIGSQGNETITADEVARPLGDDQL